jgi:hypothetical protein
MWDYLKNDPAQRDKHRNWKLNWIGALPGKRESRRYIGAYTMTENDVLAGGNFEDEVAFGGWTMDDHFPEGFYYPKGSSTIFHPAPTPYGLPLRCMIAKTIKNLTFAGRNISATHCGFASTRVMGTIGLLGQAAGTAAAIAVRYGLTPREAAQQKITEIQNQLMEDDCFLPGLRRKPSALTEAARLTCDYGDCSNLLNGLDRRIWGNDNGYFGKTNKAITYTFEKPEFVSGVRLVLDSDLDREYTEGNPDGLHTSAVLFFPKSHNNTRFGFPKCLIKRYKIEILTEDDRWETALEVTDNHQRFIKHTLNTTAKAVRFIPLSTYHSETKTEDYGSSTAHIFNFEVF